jgi:hypothetical protein
VSTILVFAAGIVVFTIVTLASLWVGYLSFQHAWVAENPDVPREDDDIRPLTGSYEALRSQPAQSPPATEQDR